MLQKERERCNIVMEGRNIVGTKKRIGKQVWSILIIVVGIQILFDPISSARNLSEDIEARVRLPMARQKWETQKIGHYAFDVSAGTDGGGCIWQAKLEVKRGVVTLAGNRSDLPDLSKYPDYPIFRPREPSSPNTPFMCNYHKFTMPQLFDFVETALEKFPSQVTQISFDPTYGFITRVRFGSPNARGLFSWRVDHCCSGIGIDNFQVLEE